MSEGPVSRSLASSRQLSHRGVSALERGDVATAERLLAQAVQACPVDAEARHHYAEALWQRHEPLRAVEQLDTALKITPEDIDLRIRAGQMRLEIGDLAGARREALEALDLKPKSPEAWLLRGQVEQRAGQLRAALASYQRVLGLESDQREALLALAEIYRQLGQPERALSNLQRLSDTYPPGDEPQSVVYLEGLALAALERRADALERLRVARTRGPESPELLFQLATLQLAEGQTDEARASLTNSLAVDPNHRASRELLGRIDVARSAVTQSR